jgi:hypothetical protein
MKINARILIKGTSNEMYKGNGKYYPKVHAFGIEGAPADLDIGVDLPAQNDLFNKAGKMVGQTAMVLCDLTFYNQRANFSLIGLEPVPVK